ncbi:unnamed protein product [Ectocarpus sp. 13 AM-2016]
MRMLRGILERRSSWGSPSASWSCRIICGIVPLSEVEGCAEVDAALQNNFPGLLLWTGWQALHPALLGRLLSWYTGGVVFCRACHVRPPGFRHLVMRMLKVLNTFVLDDNRCLKNELLTIKDLLSENPTFNRRF